MTPAEITEARTLGDLAAECVPLAGELAFLVRAGDRQAVAQFLKPLDGEQRTALLIVLAAMVDIDRTPGELLGWVTWDELTGPPAPAEARGGRELAPCGTYAAYMRHKTRGEAAGRACREAAIEYWAQQKRAQRAAARGTAARPPAVVAVDGDHLTAEVFSAPRAWLHELNDPDPVARRLRAVPDRQGDASAA